MCVPLPPPETGTRLVLGGAPWPLSPFLATTEHATNSLHTTLAAAKAHLSALRLLQDQSSKLRLATWHSSKQLAQGCVSKSPPVPPQQQLKGAVLRPRSNHGTEWGMLAFLPRAVKTEGGFCFWGSFFRTAHSPITGANAELEECPCPSSWLLAAPLAPFSGTGCWKGQC
jgi:hypothetical protein